MEDNLTTLDAFAGFDEPEVEIETEIAETHGSVPSTKDDLAPDMWGQFCFDFALRVTDSADAAGVQEVLDAYGLSESCFLQLLDNKSFVARLKDAQLQTKTLGPTAGFVLSARTQAERHLVTLGRIAASDITHPAVRVKAIENLVRYAHLDPQTQKQAKEGEQRSTSPGVLVQFNIGGGLLGSNRQTIEVQAQPITQGETE